MTVIRVTDAADIPRGQGRYVEANGLGFALFNAGGGRYYACGDLCPHEDGPLAEGWLEGDTVICPWHGYDFELATGRCRANEDLSIPIYPVRVITGVVEVEVPW